jgi:hypothetical protein
VPLCVDIFKHTSLGIFNPIVEDLLQLEEGVRVGQKLMKAALVFLACDTVAARAITGFVPHNSYCHCFLCNAIGKWINYRMVITHEEYRTPYSVDEINAIKECVLKEYQTSIGDLSDLHSYPPIFQLEGPVEGIKSFSPLQRLSYWYVQNGIALDFLHVLCEGHFAQLLSIWISKYHNGIAELDKVWQQQKLPRWLHLQPRSIFQNGIWRGIEYFILFCCFFELFQGHLPQHIYEHHLEAIKAIRTLLNPCTKDVVHSLIPFFKEYTD